MGIQHEVAIFPERRYVSLKEERAEERQAAQRHLARVIEKHPLTEEQRRILVMALGALAILDNSAG